MEMNTHDGVYHKGFVVFLFLVILTLISHVLVDLRSTDPVYSNVLYV